MFTNAQVKNNEKRDVNDPTSLLLESRLPNDIMAENILACLHRSCCHQAMTVAPLVQRFSLSKYYCAEHGTKLEKQQEHEKQPQEAPQSPTLKCEDCVQAESGNKRCPECEDFYSYEDVTAAWCDFCFWEGCADCVDAWKCKDCDKYSCNDGCPMVEYCSRCDETFCSECRDSLYCDHHLCGSHSCSDCDLMYCCFICDQNFCKSHGYYEDEDGSPHCTDCETYPGVIYDPEESLYE